MRYYIKKQGLEDQLFVLPAKFATQYYSFSLPKGRELLSRVNPALLREINSGDWQNTLKE